MNKTQTMIVASLVTLAVVLCFLLVITPMQPRAAYGDNSASLGDFTLLVAGPSPGSPETLLTVVDNRSQRMLSYEFVNNQFRVIGGADLGKVFAVPVGRP